MRFCKLYTTAATKPREKSTQSKSSKIWEPVNEPTFAGWTGLMKRGQFLAKLGLVVRPRWTDQSGAN